MDINNDGIIDDPFVIGKKMGRPCSPIPFDERRKAYNEKHKAWSKRMTKEKKRGAILSLFADFGISPNNVNEKYLECAVNDSSLVIYYKKA